MLSKSALVHFGTLRMLLRTETEMSSYMTTFGQPFFPLCGEFSFEISTLEFPFLIYTSWNTLPHQDVRAVDSIFFLLLSYFFPEQIWNIKTFCCYILALEGGKRDRKIEFPASLLLVDSLNLSSSRWKQDENMISPQAEAS